MGWGSGSRLMSAVISGLQQREVSADNRKIMYEVLIPAMQDRDWDTEMDCMGEDIAYDDTLEKLHPNWFEESEDLD